MVAPGEVIGVYELDRLLGAGSTSKVFLGRHTLLGRQAAIKVLAPELVSNQDVVSRLLTEARVVNDIRHPNIIDIIDFVVIDKPRRVALVMELIEGPSLMTLRGFEFDFAQALGLGLQLIDAVAAAHAAGVIHRDIKPDNLLLLEDPRETKGIPTLKVVDFGIAKLAGKSGRTATGMMLGTPAYMAPEQVAGRPPPSTATDIFAIGEVLYELLAGERAFPSQAIHETVRAKLRGELPDLKLPADMPGQGKLLALIVKCLERRGEDRPGIDEIRRTLVELFPRNWRPSASLGEKLIANTVSGGNMLPDLVPATTALSPLDPAEFVGSGETGPVMSSLAPPSVDATADPAIDQNKPPVTKPMPVARPDEITDQGQHYDDDEFASTVLSFDDDVVNSPTLPPPAQTEIAPGGLIPRDASRPTDDSMGPVKNGTVPVPSDDTAVTTLGRDALLQPVGVQEEVPPTNPTHDAILDEKEPDRRRSRLTKELELAVDAAAGQEIPLADTLRDPDSSADEARERSHDDPAHNHSPPSLIMPRQARGTVSGTRPKRSGIWLLVGGLWLIAMVLIVSVFMLPSGPPARTNGTPPPPQEELPRVTRRPGVEPIVINSDPQGAKVFDVDTGAALGTTPFEIGDDHHAVRRVRLEREGTKPVEIDLATADGKVWVELD